MERSKTCITALVSGIFLCAQGSAQVTQRVSLDWYGGQTNGPSHTNWISANGRYVAFESKSSDIVLGDTNGAFDIFVRDRVLGTNERVSVSSSEEQGNGSPDEPFPPYLSLSGDGRVVVFSSDATNLVAGDTNGSFDLFARDRLLGTTERVSVDSAGLQANGQTRESSTSGDGRYVAFSCLANNLVPGDTNGWTDIFVRDRLAGTTERVSVHTSGAQANSNSQYAAISADGRFVAFASYASNLVSGDFNGFPDVFVRDRTAGTTERISVAPGGGEPNGSCLPSTVSADGRFVAFSSDATNLVAGDTNGQWDTFVFDRQSGTTERVSVATGGAQANGGSEGLAFPAATISADGRYVAFVSESTNLVAGDTNGVMDVFVRDRLLGRTDRASVGTEAIQGNSHSMNPSISRDGRFVSFSSIANNFTAPDNNGLPDIFVRDHTPSGFTSLCDPGVDGVIACPCSNPPSGPGRGCDNSSATGGAVLAASGEPYLSLDTLTFTTSGQRRTTASIVSQWTGANPTGVVFGQGVRCTSGTLKRLYTKVSSGGSITAPDFPAGDPPVSVRSAALGDTILEGQSRWYFVHYRDSFVLGGCPPTSTFNATQTGQVTWSP